MKRLAIFGASGHGKVVADCAECAGWQEIEFFDDAWPKLKTTGSWQVVGDTKLLINDLDKYDGVIVAIGNNITRLKKQEELNINGAQIVSIVHPVAQVSRYVNLGAGSVVMPGAIINTDSTLGACCIINTGATIDHDCVLGDGVHVSPGANIAGGVSIGNRSWIGIGSSIRQLVKIGDESIVGAGAVVINDVADTCTVAGNPANLLKTFD